MDAVLGEKRDTIAFLQARSDEGVGESVGLLRRVPIGHRVLAVDGEQGLRLFTGMKVQEIVQSQAVHPPR